MIYRCFMKECPVFAEHRSKQLLGRTRIGVLYLFAVFLFRRTFRYLLLTSQGQVILAAKVCAWPTIKFILQRTLYPLFHTLGIWHNPVGGTLSAHITSRSQIALGALWLFVASGIWFAERLRRRCCRFVGSR